MFQRLWTKLISVVSKPLQFQHNHHTNARADAHPRIYACIHTYKHTYKLIFFVFPTLSLISIYLCLTCYIIRYPFTHSTSLSLPLLCYFFLLTCVFYLFSFDIFLILFLRPYLTFLFSLIFLTFYFFPCFLPLSFISLYKYLVISLLLLFLYYLHNFCSSHTRFLFPFPAFSQRYLFTKLSRSPFFFLYIFSTYLYNYNHKSTTYF